MSPFCGAHQPRHLGSRLMGFLLPGVWELSNEPVSALHIVEWWQKNLIEFIFSYSK